MSARRPSFDKRERDRAKKAKAAAKREKRLEKGTDEENEDAPTSDQPAAAGGNDQQSVLAELEALHKKYDAEEIEFEEFEEQRTALLERLNVD